MSGEIDARVEAVALALYGSDAICDELNFHACSLPQCLCQYAASYVVAALAAQTEPARVTCQFCGTESNASDPANCGSRDEATRCSWFQQQALAQTEPATPPPDLGEALKRLIYAAQGGNADGDNPKLLRHVAETIYDGTPANSELVRALRERATMLESALAFARVTLTQAQGAKS